MESEAWSLSKFLEDYDDNKEDHKYYRGTAYSRRRREREAEMEKDERDRQREKEEMEALRLEVMERQVREREREAGVSRTGSKVWHRGSGEGEVLLHWCVTNLCIRMASPVLGVEGVMKMRRMS